MDERLDEMTDERIREWAAEFLGDVGNSPEVVTDLRAVIRRAVDEAVAEEREACAKLADAFDSEGDTGEAILARATSSPSALPRP